MVVLTAFWAVLGGCAKFAHPSHQQKSPESLLRARPHDWPLRWMVTRQRSLETTHPREQERSAFFRLNYQQTAFIHLSGYLCPYQAKQPGWGRQAQEAKLRRRVRSSRTSPRRTREPRLFNVLRPAGRVTRTAPRSPPLPVPGRIPGIVSLRGPAQLGGSSEPRERAMVPSA